MNRTRLTPKEHGILFSGEMVRAILDGSKTQTRRDAKLFDDPSDWRFNHEDEDFGFCFDQISKDRPNGTEGLVFKCPYGTVGDRLWVRETWCKFDDDHIMGDKLCAYRADTSADGEEIRKEYVKCGRPYQWKPSIHMPRWASRLTLEIVSVKVERLQDISEEDARAEGVVLPNLPLYADEPLPTYRNAFARLWESINGPGSWDRNDFVWAIEFKVVK